MATVQDGSMLSLQDAIYGRFTYPEYKKDKDGNEVREDKPIRFSKLQELEAGVVSDDGNYIIDFGINAGLKVTKIQKPVEEQKSTKQASSQEHGVEVVKENGGRGSTKIERSTR